jgi:hypothetical protein
MAGLYEGVNRQAALMRICPQSCMEAMAFSFV